MNTESKGKKNPIVYLAIISAIALLVGYGWIRSTRRQESVKRTQVALGTFVEIEVRGMTPRDANQAISAAFRELIRIHDEFSPFNESGLLWKINHEEKNTVHIGKELYSLLEVCDDIHEKTEGAFDPAMERLFRIWRIWGDTPVLPSTEEVEAARDLSGWRHIRLGGNLELRRKPGVEISFGAVAKGYAVDRMTAVLQDFGVGNALVNAGGEIRTLGENWIVGIQHPSIREEMIRTISLKGMAVATSGDYEQYHEEKGKRYHHILDPATGYPATGCRSVTIVAETCMEADAYATGVFVLGPERGMNLVNRTPDMEAMVIDRSGTVSYSKGFAEYLRRLP